MPPSCEGQTMLRVSQSLSCSLRRFLAVLILVCLAVIWPAAVQAEHDHDHVFVTIDEYLGYDSDAEISKVRVSTSSVTYIISMHGSLRALADHEGEQARVSLSSGAWKYIAVPGHDGAVRIHSVKRLE